MRRGLGGRIGLGGGWVGDGGFGGIGDGGDGGNHLWGHRYYEIDWMRSRTRPRGSRKEPVELILSSSSWSKKPTESSVLKASSLVIFALL